ncbi:unnamed protein product [Owenia fusiformis]|uniref:Uncharacterized protein n=1 Tax=Owenia fusiformis TaxID=6347 RepID=A0A8J1UT63_OWEFU|nr:unnamed protein product [Owenia fusiformis]
MPKSRRPMAPYERTIFRSSYAKQSTAKGCVRLSQVPMDMVYDMSDRFQMGDVPALLTELDKCSYGPGFDAKICMDSLKSILGSLTNYESRRAQDDVGAQEETAKTAKALIEHDGVNILMKVIMFESVLPFNAVKSKETDTLLRLKSMCLEVLTRIISTEKGEEVADLLTQHDDVVMYLFTLLCHNKTALTAMTMLEDMLQQRRQVFNLTRITNIRQIIKKLDNRKLAIFCRVLAVTISNLDIYENKSSLFAQNKQKRSKGFVNVRDVNQELLLSIPDLLDRLVDIACIKVYTPRYRSMQSELDCWMEWIDNSLSDCAFDEPITDDWENFIGGISEPVSSSGPMVHQPGLEMGADLVTRVQVVYVLGLFLIGKHRKKVQRKLADLKMIPGLSNMFDEFIWKCQVNTRHRLRGHNASCECSPEVALKIQFLRLVHSFCDHSEHKHLLLSKSELAELKRINNKAANLSIDTLDNVNQDNVCRGGKGLLTKIVEVMKKEPTASTFRFWLARAVESYLRGSTSYCDQVFLLRRGLLTHISSNIIDHDIRPKEILQSSFDLLGELIKFNIDSFRAFDKVLDTDAKFDRFISIMNRSLVDSNMFLRALILSLDDFTNKTKGQEYKSDDNRLLKHISNFGQQMMYLHKLINIINVQNLTQENVSCLNTSLVFLMFSNKENKMPKYLKALSEERHIKGCDKKGGNTMMKNFRDLLVFWQEHYLHKDKDCSALEKSSRLSFEFWKQTVNELVSEDRTKKSAILHYVPHSYNLRSS